MSTLKLALILVLLVICLAARINYIATAAADSNTWVQAGEEMRRSVHKGIKRDAGLLCGQKNNIRLVCVEPVFYVSSYLETYEKSCMCFNSFLVTAVSQDQRNFLQKKMCSGTCLHSYQRHIYYPSHCHFGMVSQNYLVLHLFAVIIFL